jgi:hypothetical protein
MVLHLPELAPQKRVKVKQNWQTGGGLLQVSAAERERQQQVEAEKIQRYESQLVQLPYAHFGQGRAYLN